MSEASTLSPIGPRTRLAFKPIARWQENLSLGVKYHRGEFAVRGILDYSADKLFVGITRETTLLQERLINAAFDKKGVLRFPASFINSAIVAAVCPRGSWRYADKLSHDTFVGKVGEYMLYRKGVEQQADFKRSQVLPYGAIDLQATVKHEPGDAQRVAAYISQLVGNYAFFMPMGTGKTFTAIMSAENQALQGRHSDEKPFRVLVACPTSVLTNWQLEVGKFKSLASHTQVLAGSRIQRAQEFLQYAALPSRSADSALGADVSYLIVSHDVLRNDAKLLAGIPWDLMIYDESQKIKDAKAERTKAAFKVAENAAARLILTGTPVPNTAPDLFAQLELLSPQCTCCKSASEFKKTFGVLVEVDTGQGFNTQKVVGTRQEDVLREILAVMSFSIPKEVALKGLPPKLYNTAEVSMGKAQSKAYKSLADGIKAKIEEELATAEASGLSDVMVVNNALTQMLRLAQITSGYAVTSDIYTDVGDLQKEGQTIRFDPNPKVEWLVSTLKEKPLTSKTLVWTSQTQDIASICGRLDVEGIEYARYQGSSSRVQRDDAVSRFNKDPNCRVFVGNADAGGTGLNLQGQCDDETNCDHIVYFSCNWNGATRQQSEDRPHRRGTRVPVQITDLIVPDTIDVEIRERLTKKRDDAIKLTDVREILSKLGG